MTYGGATGQRQLAQKGRGRRHHVRDVMQNPGKSCWKFRVGRLELQPSGRKSRFDVIVFVLRKRPGGSAPNRDFSLSVPKMDFF